MLLLLSMVIDEEPACWSIVNSILNYGMCLICWFGYFNEYISIQDGIIVIIVLIFLFSGLKNVYSLVSKILYFTLHKTHNII